MTVPKPIWIWVITKDFEHPYIQCQQCNNGKDLSNRDQQRASGDYLGKTVQVIPHITDEIKRRMRLLENESITTSLLRKLVELLVTLKVCLTLKRSGN